MLFHSLPGPYDRRSVPRFRSGLGKLSCWRFGEKLDLAIIEMSLWGARVVLPPVLLGEHDLFLVHERQSRLAHLEFRVAWVSELVGGNAIAGLELVMASALAAA